MGIIKSHKSTSTKPILFTIIMLVVIFSTFVFGVSIGTSISNMIRHIRSPIIHKPIRTRINFTKTTNKSFESFICDDTHLNRFPISSTIPSSNDSFDIYRKISLEKYCKIVPIPRLPYIKPQTYSEDEIAFVIFTASSFFQTRALATHDTWLSRVTNYYFLSATPYSYLPVTVVPGAGENKLSNMKKLFYGLQIIYQQQMNLPIDQRQKWFYIAGCDTFILPHHLIKRLDGLDYTKPIFLGGRPGQHQCLGKIKPKITVEFPSGGAGFFFSMKLLEMLQPTLTNFVKNIWPRYSIMSDVALTCLITQLGINLTKQVGFWSHPPSFTFKEVGREIFHNESEPNGFHYIQPDEMYALDEFYVNQHMDRLIKAENWKELTKFTRRFVSSHYVLLRKKRRDCILPKIGDEIKLKKWFNFFR